MHCAYLIDEYWYTITAYLRCHILRGKSRNIRSTLTFTLVWNIGNGQSNQWFCEATQIWSISVPFIPHINRILGISYIFMYWRRYPCKNSCVYLQHLTCTEMCTCQNYVMKNFKINFFDREYRRNRLNYVVITSSTVSD